jgi:hypothetical protein
MKPQKNSIHNSHMMGAALSLASSAIPFLVFCSRCVACRKCIGQQPKFVQQKLFKSRLRAYMSSVSCTCAH